MIIMTISPVPVDTKWCVISPTPWSESVREAASVDFTASGDAWIQSPVTDLTYHIFG